MNNTKDYKYMSASLRKWLLRAFGLAVVAISITLSVFSIFHFRKLNLNYLDMFLIFCCGAGVVPAIFLLFFFIVGPSSKKILLDGHKVEIYAGIIRLYIRVDGRIVAHKPNTYFINSCLTAVAGYNKIIVNIISFTLPFKKIKINVEKIIYNITESKQKNETFDTKSSIKEIYLKEKNSVLKKKLLEKRLVTAIYIITIILIAALIGGAVAFGITGAEHILIELCAALAVFIGIVGFKYRCKYYEVDGHNVILYTGWIIKYMSVEDYDVIETSYTSERQKIIIFHSKIGDKILESTFTGYRYMDLKIIRN